jgi:hypothetical protein
VLIADEPLPVGPDVSVELDKGYGTEEADGLETGPEEREERRLVGNEPDEYCEMPLAEIVPVLLNVDRVAFVSGYGADDPEPLARGPEEAEAAVVSPGVDEPYVPVEFDGPGEMVKGSGLSVTKLLVTPVPVGPAPGPADGAVEFNSGYGAEEPELGTGSPDVGKAVPVVEGRLAGPLVEGDEVELAPVDGAGGDDLDVVYERGNGRPEPVASELPVGPVGP